MKLKTGILALALALVTTAHGATNDLTGLLQKGLFEEEANRDLNAAISDYESLASDFDKDRQLAATAIFRLGECYRKLGKTNEAVVQYQRIVKEFGDQQTLVTLSRQNLAGLGTSAPSERSNSELEQVHVNAEAQLAQSQALLRTLEAMRPEALRQVLPGVVTDSQLNTLLSESDQARQQLIQLKTQYGPDHPKYVNAMDLANDLDKKVNERMVGILLGLHAKADSEKAYLDVVEKNIQKAQVSNPPPQSNQSDKAATTDDEEKQIRDIQAMIQNSPDLINAPSAGVNGDETPLQSAAEKGQLVVAKYLLDHGADVNGTGWNRIGAPLFLAAQNGHKAMVELLLARGADVNGKPGPNPLYRAVSKGFTGVVDVLLANKADLNARGENGMQALHAAVSGGRANLIQSLIDHGADVNVADFNGKSPLHFAATAKAPDAARILLTSKADVDAKDKGGSTPLHDAAQAGNTAVASLLLDSAASVDATNGYNTTPLIFAVANGAVDTTRVLLAHKADPNYKGALPNWPSSKPVDFAVGKKNNEILRLLLDAGANPDENDMPSGALNYAVNNDSVDSVQLLLQHGANPNRRDNDGNSPLNEAVNYKRNTRIISMLLDKGADPNAPDANGMSPLFNSTNSQIGRALVDHKADLNARLADGKTPLMRTFAYDTNYLKFLLENGAKPDLQDTNGNTALHFAIYNAQSPAFIEILLAHKANPNIQNNDGNTPLDAAKARISEPVRFARPNAGRTVSTEDAQKIVEMLIEAGGMANLPKRDRIAIRRGSAVDYSIFSKGPRDWNRFSLLEVIATDYGLISTVRSGDWSPRSNWADLALPFPDFKKVVIYRRGSDPMKQTGTEVNVEKILADHDCSQDVWLDWGDVVEIPEADHPVDEGWPGLSVSVENALTNCVSRQITIKIKGESTVLTLAPEGRVETPTGPGRLESFRNRISMHPYPGASSSRPSFMLRSVLDNSKLIRVSSDLSHVKVTRHDPMTKKTVEWVVDCTDPNRTDLWLRDGDVIEVPEK